MYEFEVATAAYELLKAMNVNPADSVAISCDTLSDMLIVDAVARAAVALDAKPLVLKIPTPEKEEDMPTKALAATIRGCEAWVEVNGFQLHGTKTYEAIHEGKSIKYACLVGTDRETLVKEIVRTGSADLTRYQAPRA